MSSLKQPLLLNGDDEMEMRGRSTNPAISASFRSASGGRNGSRTRTGRLGSLIRQKSFAVRRRVTEGHATPVTKLWCILIATVVVWAVGGMLVYAAYEDWTNTQALFYAVNVGLGVGYGKYNVSTPFTKVFTVFYCLVGSSFIAGAGALMVQSVLERQGALLDDAKRNFVHQGEQDHHPDSAVREQISRWQYFVQKRKGRLIVVGSFVFWVLVGVAFSMEGHLDCCTACVKDGAGSSVSDEPGNRCNDFAEGLFFVITSMSTASQVPPKGDAFSLGFTIVYIFVGIPIYGAILSMVADTYIEKFQRKQMRIMVAKTPTSRGTFLQVRLLSTDWRFLVLLLNRD
jgi:hypothetical protein